MNVYLTSGDTRFPFMKFPRFLLDTGLNETCQILYVLLLDRARLSQKNRWVDEDDHVFIYYPIQSLAKDMHKGVTTIKDSLKRLQEADLIDRQLDTGLAMLKRYGDELLAVIFGMKNAAEAIKAAENSDD